MLFKVANELLDKKQEQILPIHADAKELAGEFNKYYIAKVKKIRQSISTNTIVPECCKRKFEGTLLTNFTPTNEKSFEEGTFDGVKCSLIAPLL